MTARTSHACLGTTSVNAWDWLANPGSKQTYHGSSLLARPVQIVPRPVHLSRQGLRAHIPDWMVARGCSTESMPPGWQMQSLFLVRGAAGTAATLPERAVNQEPATQPAIAAEFCRRRHVQVCRHSAEGWRKRAGPEDSGQRTITSVVGLRQEHAELFKFKFYCTLFTESENHKALYNYYRKKKKRAHSGRN